MVSASVFLHALPPSPTEQQLTPPAGCDPAQTRLSALSLHHPRSQVDSAAGTQLHPESKFSPV
ncbi:hypothetical protein FQA47_022326 [Oryzias melastigma]|uniref:Uncharacterized protein n=1 Tax=Oryzias melastigma TaxID=30732 RepID=A0A834F038_ORYME|nr:hypothetical protein FQA47_022326 [Oryzias melastigma]